MGFTHVNKHLLVCHRDWSAHHQSQSGLAQHLLLGTAQHPEGRIPGNLSFVVARGNLFRL